LPVDSKDGFIVVGRILFAFLRQGRGQAGRLVLGQTSLLGGVLILLVLHHPVKPKKHQRRKIREAVCSTWRFLEDSSFERKIFLSFLLLIWYVH
jgi:hypothetical protein